MAREMREQVGELQYENLVVDTSFPVQKTVVTLKAGQGSLQPGAVIGLDVQRIGHLLDGTVVTEPHSVLLEAIDTGTDTEGENVPAVVYISGTLNRSALIFGASETVDKYEDKLRTLGIYLREII